MEKPRFVQDCDQSNDLQIIKGPSNSNILHFAVICDNIVIFNHLIMTKHLEGPVCEILWHLMARRGTAKQCHCFCCVFFQSLMTCTSANECFHIPVSALQIFQARHNMSKKTSTPRVQTTFPLHINQAHLIRRRRTGGAKLGLCLAAQSHSCVRLYTALCQPATRQSHKQKKRVGGKKKKMGIH